MDYIYDILYRLLDYVWKLRFPELRPIRVDISSTTNVVDNKKIYTSIIPFSRMFHESKHVKYTNSYIVIYSPYGHIIFAKKTKHLIFDITYNSKNKRVSFFEVNNNLVPVLRILHPFQLIMPGICGGLTLSAPHPFKTDLHSHAILTSGNILLLGKYHILKKNPHTIITSFSLHEFDNQGILIHTWHMHNSDLQLTLPQTHHGTTNMFSIMHNRYDLHHANSITECADGTVLVSCRHTNEILKIDRYKDLILWRLGGALGNFAFINNQEIFSHQHSAHELFNGDILLYDNGNGKIPQKTCVSQYRLLKEKSQVKRVWTFENNDIFTDSTGSVQRLTNGNTFVGWGNSNTDKQPIITEIDSKGNVCLEITYTKSYGKIIGLYSAKKF